SARPRDGAERARLRSRNTLAASARQASEVRAERRSRSEPPEGTAAKRRRRAHAHATERSEPAVAAGTRSLLRRGRLAKCERSGGAEASRRRGPPRSGGGERTPTRRSGASPPSQPEHARCFGEAG